jgi:hypothetical protein
LALGVALAVLAGPAAAQGSRPQLLIVQAEADLDAETLLVRGQYFLWAGDDSAVVTLADREPPEALPKRGKHCRRPQPFAGASVSVAGSP